MPNIDTDIFVSPESIQTDKESEQPVEAEVAYDDDIDEITNDAHGLIDETVDMFAEFNDK